MIKKIRNIVLLTILLGGFIWTFYYLYEKSQKPPEQFETVSPFDKKEDKPIGGRSMWTNSIELRNRVGKDFGWVVFYDFGNVYKRSWPEFGHRILHSTGLGARYHTPIGPLRLDLAVPLNRREGIDSMFEVYFSIGQSF